MQAAGLGSLLSVPRQETTSRCGHPTHPLFLAPPHLTFLPHPCLSSCLTSQAILPFLANQKLQPLLSSLLYSSTTSTLVPSPPLPSHLLQAVQQVVTNLQVSHIELRSEDSFDIQAYVHERKVEKEVVPIEGELLEVKTAFLKVGGLQEPMIPRRGLALLHSTASCSQVLSGVVSRLSRHNLLYHSNPDRLGKYQLLQSRDQFRQAGPPPGVQVGTV